MASTDPTTKVGAIRAALKARLMTTGIDVLEWPADAQALPLPCWTIGIPEHAIQSVHGGGERELLGPDFELGSWAWEMAWPLTLYVPLVNDDTSTEVIDAQVGELIAAIRSDVTLSGECLDASVRGIDHSLSDDDKPIRMHEVTAVVVTLSKMPDA